MHLKIKHFVIIITLAILGSCKEQPQALERVKASNVQVDTSFTVVDSILEYTRPYRKRIDAVLDSTLAYAPKIISKTDGEYNTTAGNLMADIILEQAQPIFKSRTAKNIDFVLVNHGGIRAIISKGNVSARNAYQVMPFENTIVVVELSGTSVLSMVDFLIKSKRAHPVSGIQIVLNGQGELHDLKINGKAVQKDRNYNVATSNYLVSGGDDMVFFKEGKRFTDTDYLIRNAMIDFFKKVDTLHAAVDDRYYKIE